MVWIDQRDVAVQHLALAQEAIARARGDANATASPDVVTALDELRAASLALARLAGAPVDEDQPQR